MKTKLILFLLIILVNFSYSQESKKYLKLKKSYKYREGYLINKDSLKVKGLIKDNLMQEAMIYSIMKFVHINGTKVSYHPSDIKGFQYSNYKFVSDNSLFYKIIRQGKKVSLYNNLSVHSTSTPGPPGMGSSHIVRVNENFYVKRPDENSFKLVKKRKFKDEFSEYFSDCEEVVNDILSEKLTHKDIKAIVNKYNYCK